MVRKRSTVSLLSATAKLPKGKADIASEAADISAFFATQTSVSRTRFFCILSSPRCRGKSTVASSSTAASTRKSIRKSGLAVSNRGRRRILRRSEGRNKKRGTRNKKEDKSRSNGSGKEKEDGTEEWRKYSSWLTRIHDPGACNLRRAEKRVGVRMA